MISILTGFIYIFSLYNNLYFTIFTLNIDISLNIYSYSYSLLLYIVSVKRIKGSCNYSCFDIYFELRFIYKMFLQDKQWRR